MLPVKKSDTKECVLCDSIVMAIAAYGFAWRRECLGWEMRNALAANCILFVDFDSDMGCVNFVIT